MSLDLLERRDTTFAVPQSNLVEKLDESELNVTCPQDDYADKSHGSVKRSAAIIYLQ